jgi:triosephosphate isomerase (TIM)
LKTSTPGRSRIVIGNWKMHGNAMENAALLGALIAGGVDLEERVEVGVCVPFPYLHQTRDLLQGSSIAWGTQDISSQTKGAFTGEVSAAMAAEFGCRYAIVGHSERRSYHAECSSVIAEKARRALEHGVIPVVCVGEALEEREAGKTRDVISMQVSEVLDSLSAAEARQLVIAYEPLWAIGTGKSATAAEAQEVHAHIRTLLATRDPELATTPLVYGGSVKAAAAMDLFRQPDIDGALVGGASLDPKEFIAICGAANPHQSTVS